MMNQQRLTNLLLGLILLEEHPQRKLGARQRWVSLSSIGKGKAE